jgi:hypothetical protein
LKDLIRAAVALNLKGKAKPNPKSKPKLTPKRKPKSKGAGSSKRTR